MSYQRHMILAEHHWVVSHTMGDHTTKFGPVPRRMTRSGMTRLDYTQ